MEDYLKSAIEIVTAQASARPMTEEEITSMIAKVAAGIQAAAGGEVITSVGEAAPALDAKGSIKESSITCLECGKKFKVLTKKHLAHHGLTPDEYRAKYGLKKGQPLACKALARERRKKMGEIRLWEKRKKPETPVQQ